MEENIKIHLDTDWKEVAKLRDEIKKLEDDLKKLDTRKNPKAAKAIVSEIEKSTKKMKDLVAEAEFAKAKTTALGQSLFNFAQDLPSAFSSTNTFLSTLKKHLPEILNQIMLVKAANSQLAAQGKATIPVWKQLGKGLLSWQTVLVTGLSVLISYTPKFVEWIKEASKANDPLSKLADANQSINEHFKNNNTELGPLIYKFKALREEWINLGGDAEKQEKFIKTNKERFDELGISINNVKEAEDKFVNNTDAVVNGLRERAKALSAETLAKKKFQESQATFNEAESERRKGPNYLDKFLAVMANSGTSRLGAFGPTKKIVTKEDTHQDRVNGLVDKSNKQEAEGEQLMKIENDLRGGNYEYITIKKGKKKKDEDPTKEATTSTETTTPTDNPLGTPPSFPTELFDQEKKIAEELLNLRKENAQKNIAQIEDEGEKEKAQLKLNYDNQIEEIRKKEKEWSEAKEDGRLTRDESAEISTAYTLAENEYINGTNKVDEEAAKAKLESMRNYLKEYGTFQQQKLAIAEEYAEKIKKAESEGNTGEANRLRKQESSAMAGVEVSAIKANVDWPTVFGEFGSMFEDVVKTKLDAAEKYKETEEFKNADPGTQKELTGLIDQMKKSLGGSGGLDFKKLGVDVKAYQDSLISLNNATIAEADAKDKLKKANEDYNKVLKEGTAEEKKVAEEAVDIAKKNADAASENVKAQTDIVNQNEKDASDTATNLKKNMDNVTEGMSKLASGGLKNAYDGLLQMGKGAGGAMEKVADSLSDVPIIGWIVSIIDVLKDGLSNLVGGLLDAIFNAVSGIIEDIFSGDLFVTIGKSLMSGISKIFDAISFGGFSSLVDSIHGGNAKEVQKAIEHLTTRNVTLGKSIDRLTDVMDKVAGMESISAYEQAYKYQEEQNDNLLNIAREQAGYSNNHHSWNKYMRWTDEQLKWAQENVDKSFSGSNSLWGLTPEQMNKLLSNASIYEQIGNAGEGGYGWRLMEKLEAYADQSGSLDDLTNKINESLMQISFDGIRDNFLSSLMDMDKDAKSFSDDFSEYMQQALLNFALGGIIDEELKSWYDDLADLMKIQKGKLTNKQIEDARIKYDEMVQDAMNARDEIAALTGYTGSDSSSTQQDSTKRGFESMSQDTGEELNGRFTALQMAGEEIKAQNVLQTEALILNGSRLEALLVAEAEHINIADETREIIVSSYLELQSIRENTGAIVKPINNMSEKLDTIERKIQTL